MSLATNVSLLLAATDLAVVKSIRGAMHAADVASGKGVAATALGPAPDRNPGASRIDNFEHRHHFLSEPVYEPRRHIHPTPVYERRPVIHERPRIALEPLAPAPSEGAPATKRLPDAVWKTLPQINRESSHQKIKTVTRMHDKDHTGQMIDLFI